jgi:hypothetical protein
MECEDSRPFDKLRASSQGKLSAVLRAQLEFLGADRTYFVPEAITTETPNATLSPSTSSRTAACTSA